MNTLERERIEAKTAGWEDRLVMGTGHGGRDGASGGAGTVNENGVGTGMETRTGAGIDDTTEQSNEDAEMTHRQQDWLTVHSFWSTVVDGMSWKGDFSVVKRKGSSCSCIGRI